MDFAACAGVTAAKLLSERTAASSFEIATNRVIYHFDVSPVLVSRRHVHDVPFDGVGQR